MPFEVGLWEIHWVREQIKATFGNYRNWCRFCAIAGEIEIKLLCASV